MDHFAAFYSLSRSLEKLPVSESLIMQLLLTNFNAIYSPLQWITAIGPLDIDREYVVIAIRHFKRRAGAQARAGVQHEFVQLSVQRRGHPGTTWTLEISRQLAPWQNRHHDTLFSVLGISGDAEDTVRPVDPGKHQPPEGLADLLIWEQAAAPPLVAISALIHLLCGELGRYHPLDGNCYALSAGIIEVVHQNFDGSQQDAPLGYLLRKNHLFRFIPAGVVFGQSAVGRANTLYQTYHHAHPFDVAPTV